jgi:predicted kinase
VRVQSQLRAFDCLEFEPSFRWIDTADEIAFLLTDLDSRNRPAHAQAFLGGYLEQGGDYQGCRFLDLYKAYRSLVRAKVAVLGVAGSADRALINRAHDRYNAYIRCAYGSLSPKRTLLILMSGLSGSGKTWLATHLAPPFGAIHIRSDIERKRLAGLCASDQSGSAVGEGLYSSGMSARVHRHLLDAAESTLSGGYTTIVDATFSRREDRARFAELGQRLGVTVRLIHCQAPLDVMRSRILDRKRLSDDPSEADLAVLEWQQKHYEPLEVDESFDVFEASSSDPSVLDRLKRDLAVHLTSS